MCVFISKTFLVFITSLFVYGCQSGSSRKNEHLPDPYEKFNRHIFAFNNFVDKYALEPVAISYNAITPASLRLLVHNELDYIQSQLLLLIVYYKVMLMFYTFFGAFFINTTLGGLGLLDPSF